MITRYDPEDAIDQLDFNLDRDPERQGRLRDRVIALRDEGTQHS
jgi:hypothetical protein